MRLIRITLGTLLAFALGCASLPPTQQELAERLGQALAEGDRSQADRARDEGRKPAEVVTFLGIEPGMTVLDLIAAGGWYSEVLSIAVGPEGRVYAQNPAVVLKIRDGASDKAMTERLANNRLANVVRLDEELSELSIEPGSLDAAFTALNYHDVHNARGGDVGRAVLVGVMALLKPGGILGLIDHAGGVGDDKKLHRIDQDQVLQVARDAGFEIEAESDVLRNPADDRQKSVFAPEVRGQTDRFVLRLRKPS